MAFHVFDRHKKSLIKCFTLLNRIKVAPHESHADVKELQLIILKRLISCENTIRKYNSERKRLKASMGDKDKRLTKEEATTAKTRIAAIERDVDKYHKLLWIYREVGDGIAHLFIDAFTIKPLAFKEDPGFVSGKKGTRFERKVLRSYDPSLPVVFIMNDLTNSLRYGDYTVVGKDFPPNFLELKSGKNKMPTDRDERQRVNANKMLQYIYTDKTDTLYGREGTVTREAMHADMVRNTVEINRLIKESRTKGYSYSKPEPGLIYIVLHDANIEHYKDVLNGIEEEHSPAFTNQQKYKNVGHYPFTLLIDDPLELFEFYNGNCQIMVLLNTAQLKRDVEDAGLKVHDRTESELKTSGTLASRFVYSLKHETGAVTSYSDHFFMRIVSEFANYEWFKNELIYASIMASQRAVNSTLM